MRPTIVGTMGALVTAMLLGWSTPAGGYARAAVTTAQARPVPVIVPPPSVATPPKMAAVPGSAVQYAENLDFNLFVYSGRYYSLYNGTWFYAPSHGGPWSVMGVEKVPKPVRAVPLKYYKVPPGPAKKMATSPVGGPGKGPKK